MIGVGSRLWFLLALGWVVDIRQCWLVLVGLMVLMMSVLVLFSVVVGVGRRCSFR